MRPQVPHDARAGLPVRSHCRRQRPQAESPAASTSGMQAGAQGNQYARAPESRQGEAPHG